MRSRSAILWASALLGLTLFTTTLQTAISQTDSKPEATTISSADKATYVLTLYWIEAVRKPAQPAAPPNAGPPIPVGSGDTDSLHISKLTDLSDALYRADRRWNYRQVAALSMPFPKSGETIPPVHVSVPDGNFTIQTRSVEFPKKHPGRAVGHFAYAGVSANGDGIGGGQGGDFHTIPLEIGKAYRLASTGPSEMTYQFQVFASITRAEEKPKEMP
ncbi:MAG: hypothetical protein KY468_05175 [Armatimonadetes bacterium]|nr:hypothetical protein [Armatimonadota bacterium]